MERPTLPLSHALLALAVVAIWGTNFVVVKQALAHMPPLTMAALRFTLAFLPAAFFLKRPQVPWWNLALYGVLIGVGQFGILFIAMKSDISPGLASVLMQMQAFFTPALAVWLAGERMRGYQFAALGLAAAGLGWMILHGGSELTPLGLGLTLIASLSWSGGSMVVRANPTVNMLAYVVWGSLFSAPPLFALASLTEGWPAMTGAIAHADWTTWAAIVWQALGNTVFCYAVWGWLLARHPAAVIAPLSLLIPVFGMASSAMVLGEALPPWKLTAAGLVMSGLAMNVLWPQIAGRIRTLAPAE